MTLIVEALETLGQAARHLGAGALGEIAHLLEILHRHDAGHDRNIDARLAHTIDKAQIMLVVEEELGDGACGTGIGRIGGFEMSVAAYPEKHPDSASVEADIDNLKAKIDAGATRAITQFFFDNDHYFRYLDRVRARGIDVPIVPGLIPIHNFVQVAKFAGQCGAKIPDAVARRFDGLDDDVETTHLMAATVAAEQALGLREQGVTDFHFYTLNRAKLVYAICHLLGLRPKAENPAVAERAPEPAL